jgi:hypothetical protein
MIPVNQTRLYDPTKQHPPGNCWAACLASILECTLNDLPDEKSFWHPGDNPRKSWPPYYQKTILFLRSHYGLSWFECKVSGIVLDEMGAVYTILSGPSPRDSAITHSVVGVLDKIVHDPHPSKAGLVGELKDWTVGFFVTPIPKT